MGYKGLKIARWGLAQSQDGYPGYHRLAMQLPILKACEETCWLREAHSQILQQSRKNLDRAFRNFFEKRGGYPQFKSKRARQRIHYPQPKRNWITSDGQHLHLPKVGHVRMVMHRLLEGVMKNGTVSKTKSGKYFVSIQVEVEITEPFFAGGTVGIDLGLRDFGTLSSGEKIAPPQHYRKAQQQRRRLARQLSRKKPGSRNREKARVRLARLDERIADQRRDYHHKVSRQLVEENQCIGLEDLNIQGMTSSGKIHWRCRLVNIHRYVGVQSGLVWLPSGKSQASVSILEDLFCLWYDHALNTAAPPPVAMPCL